MILGLDISTSTVGFTLLNLTGDVVKMGYVKPIGSDYCAKVKSASKTLLYEIELEGPITSIYAEAPNMMFRTGFSSAQVISTIMRFNGAFLFTLYEKLNILPNEAMAVSMRKQVIGVGRFKKGTNTKEEVFKWVQTQVSPLNPKWPLIEKGKNQGKFMSECYDMADSYVVARYGLIYESRNSHSKSQLNQPDFSE